MATTDANGQVFYGPTDPVEPLQGLLNGISTAVSGKIGAGAQIVRIPNMAGRVGAVAARAGRAITAADPLIVWRGDAADGYQIEYTTNGTTWAGLFTTDPPMARVRISAGSIGNSPSIRDYTAWNRFDSAYFSLPSSNRLRVAQAGIYSVHLDATGTTSAFGRLDINVYTSVDNANTGVGIYGGLFSSSATVTSGSVSLNVQGSIPTVVLPAGGDFLLSALSATSGVGINLGTSYLNIRKIG